MSPALIFQIQLILGYVPWLLLGSAYLFPRFRAIDPFEVQRSIAALHSFRFFGLVFLVPGVVGSGLPTSFATSAALGDFATGLLAMLALLTVRSRVLFQIFVVAFNIVGIGDLVSDYIQGIQIDLPGHAGDLGAAYFIPVIYVPLLMITHIMAFALLFRRRAPSTASLSAA
jgi:hypothetical protein